MGNHLTGIAPSQIFPVEHYMQDLTQVMTTPNLSYDKDVSLGSTRFLKTCRAKCDSGHIVVKIFVIQDPSLSLKEDHDKLMEIRRLLESSPNCLPFQRVIFTEKAGFMVRMFVDKSGKILDCRIMPI